MTEWAVTCVFYAALHYVQAYFVSHGGDIVTHKNRASAIQRDARISGVYDEYRELESLSREARYDNTTFNQAHVTYALQSLEIIKRAVYALI
jgi:uncharacterized protein (UPF0332 family)